MKWEEHNSIQVYILWRDTFVHLYFLLMKAGTNLNFNSQYYYTDSIK